MTILIKKIEGGTLMKRDKLGDRMKKYEAVSQSHFNLFTKKKEKINNE